VLAAALAAATATVGLLVAAPAPAQADTAPPLPATPATVSADALPTVQINGVVWSQVTVGNTVYATGSFTSARPAGSAPGSNETPRRNLLAYDITTGNLVTSFNHRLNAQGLVVAASADGSRVYVGGDFTTVDGVAHNHLAAFNTATGALVNAFSPDLDARVSAIATSGNAVYVGGSFTSANGVPRARLAAVGAAAGGLMSWAPTADDNNVAALVMAPDQSKVIVGGKFSTLSGTAAYGMGAVDAASGAVLPWAANATVRNAGESAGITSLRTDGTAVYGTGFVFGPGGNLEGGFAADPSTGDLLWVQDCHGDSYDSLPVGKVLYVVTHAHTCATLGAFPETNPRSWKWATAFTTAATQTLRHNTEGGYKDWFGTPAPSQLVWYPQLEQGSVTGQGQAGWSATGNARFVALGGEFPRVNGTPQQGLVRFAVRDTAPNRMAPLSVGLTPAVTSLESGTARVAWTATSDVDNESLTYKVVRDGRTAAPVSTTTVSSTFYRRPALGFTDTGLAPGSTHTYRIYVTDPLGNTNSGSSVSVTVSSASSGAYAKQVRTDGASNYWRLGEATGSRAYDWTGYNDLVEQAGVGHGSPGALAGDPDAAAAFSGTATGTAATGTSIDAPSTFSVEAWVNTTSTDGGKLIGFGSSATGVSSTYDRHLYMDNDGRLRFGVFAGGTRTLAGPLAYNDGRWHHVVGTQSPSGMTLYVDGRRVARNAAGGNEPASGYWRVGGDNLDAWPAAPRSRNLAGTLDEVAVYPTALSTAQVQDHYTDSGRTLALPPAPTDAYGKAVTADDPDLFWRLDETAGPTAADTSASDAPGDYSGGVTFGRPTPVTGAGTGVALDGSAGLIATRTPVSNPTVYSQELWFSTTTAAGGKLVGLGNEASGRSGNYDRHVWMLNSGQLVFGAYTGVENRATSPAAYNDGAWHHLVATQGPAGMHLYVDGAEVASNPQTAAQGFTGYWRVGGDATWGGSTSNYLAGTVDEVSIYATQLSAAAVRTHYRASPASANTAPVASFTSACAGAGCSVDGSGSTDSDGSVTGYAWTFGDGAAATGATATHSYEAGGTYPVSLTVTDDQGLTTTTTQSVTVSSPPANRAPVARLTRSCTNLSCAYDGSTSGDPDGTVAAWGWDFGDGSSGAGATPTHTYPVAGDYVVTLTVTDDRGATAAATTTVSPRPPANPAVTAFATDSFSRTVTGGLGTADKGGAWTTTGAAQDLSVAGGVGSFATRTAASQASAYLGANRVTDAETSLTLTNDKAPTGNGLLASVVGRRVSSNNEYRGRLRVSGRTVSLALTKLAGSGTETVLQSDVPLAGVSYTAGTALRVRLQVAGTTPTRLRMKVWPAASTEPADWQVTATDSTAALQAAGGIGITSYLTGSATNAPVVLRVSALSAAPTTAAPTARLSTSCTGLTCTADGTASSDPGGPVSSYQWSWGDGVVTSGSTSTHAYDTAGTYRVTLTVTNAAGWRDVTTGTVTVPG
jgi:PKD repeat protein